MRLSSIPQNNDIPISNLPSSSAAILDSAKSYLSLSLALAIFAIAPLFYPGSIQTHSGFVPLWNVADLRANLGNWRWLPHVATSFDPLRSDGLWPYYLAGILPFEPLVAIKMVLGLGWLLGSAGMFLWLKNWLGQPGALVAALIYTYLPHQITTVYVRGAWGEAFFWGLLPWALLVVGEEARRRGDEQVNRGLWLILLLLTAFFRRLLSRWLSLPRLPLRLDQPLSLTTFSTPSSFSQPTGDLAPAGQVGMMACLSNWAWRLLGWPF
ncbi:MAG: hypothetical protein HYR94_00365 [Chloroflexi bacterium]|nr:hypothetical protein [Chloroflexota bacterium]